MLWGGIMKYVQTYLSSNSVQEFGQLWDDDSGVNFQIPALASPCIHPTQTPILINPPNPTQPKPSHHHPPHLQTPWRSNLDQIPTSLVFGKEELHDV